MKKKIFLCISIIGLFAGIVGMVCSAVKLVKSESKSPLYEITASSGTKYTIKLTSFQVFKDSIQLELEDGSTHFLTNDFSYKAVNPVEAKKWENSTTLFIALFIASCSVVVLAFCWLLEILDDDM